MSNKTKRIGKFCFSEETPLELCNLINQLHGSNKRVKIFNGNKETGKTWNEEHDNTGYIGRSTGPIHIPLLVYNKMSRGGQGLLDDSILAVMETTGSKNFLYKHPKLQLPTIEIIEKDGKYNTIINGELYGVHETLKEAQNCKKAVLF